MSISAEVQYSKDDGRFPNNDRRPVLVYRDAFEAETLSGGGLAEAIESRFAQNGWKGSWRNGVFPYHHYHSNTHEVLGCYTGSARVLLGGESGFVAEFRTGDVVVIPAGVAHKRISSSPDFAVVGAYPDGRSPDMNYGNADERPAALEAIRAVPDPGSDPVCGTAGPLKEYYTSGE